jgi:hypothetical protein
VILIQNYDGASTQDAGSGDLAGKLKIS